jgi:sulfur-oxidizing protein SoxX
MNRLIFAAATLAAMIAPALADDSLKADRALMEKYVNATWSKPGDDWKGRIAQDETQAICSQYRNSPPTDLADRILAREKATVVFPADGNVLGDWKKGEAIAQSGFGGRFDDKANVINGGNCYACHQMRLDEVSYGTLGPSLLGYGKDRNFDPKEARAAYAKVYNAQSVLPCSQMPRFGHHKFLSEQQMKDVVAYLFAKDSPVNK